ncbi:MAG: ATP-dependent DNA helicase RecG [Patescibacteria group bacterium]
MHGLEARQVPRRKPRNEAESRIQLYCMNLTLDAKISQLGPIAKKLANKLKKLNLETIRDLIFYYPFRYDDYSRLAKISELAEDMEATVIGKIELIAGRRTSRRKCFLTEAILTDDSGSIKLIWFNQPWISKNLAAGEIIRVYGKVSGDVFNLAFNSPAYEKYSRPQPEPVGLIPIYPLTAGLANKQLRLLIKQVLPLARGIKDFLPQEIINQAGLIDLVPALIEVHFPTEAGKLKQAKARLAFDELFLLQAWSQLLRLDLSRQQASPLAFQEKEIKEFVVSLPFKLTSDQKKTAWEILRDLGRTEPMNRLLEGDVGSGKTLVALLAMYNTALNHRQSALMAPTEILAFQHYQTARELLAGRKVNIGLLTRTQKLFNGEELAKPDFLSRVAGGEIDVIIGTHAMIQEAVKFADLALVVIDEQHRFGVKQRQGLKEKSSSKLTPHFLSLTATPIPRSLALALYGDLDISIIREMPQGRRPIITKAISAFNRQPAYGFIKQQIAAGRQVFVICPLIDPSDKLGARSVKEEYQKLNQDIFPDLPVGLMHGKLKADEKEEVMRQFKNNEISILVSTSVVEVGVDVPNATVMMIEGAERFGLSQLHQFRGRVGRGGSQSYCLLFSDSADEKTQARLEYLTKCSDGFALAEYDLKARGSGAVFGQRQSGEYDNLKIADPGDLILAQSAREAAKKFVVEFDLQQFPELRQKLEALGFTAHLE